MVHWNNSPHPVADIRDWSNSGRLELQPDFQRREVWALSAKIMLIDSILTDIPLPKIFLSKTIKEGSVYRTVIDGQQRISAILGFLRDEFQLDPPYEGTFAGKRFSDFGPDDVERFLRYRIDFNEADNPSDREVRDVYMRVNKYTVPLTKQELRRADFPGDFLETAEDLSVLPFFEDAGIFSATDRRRYADAEYTSEILAALIDGPQDKKNTLDQYYINLAKWRPDNRKSLIVRFKSAISDIEEIFRCVSSSLKETRFRQKADFYSLFVAIDELQLAGLSLEGRVLKNLVDDIRMLDEGIRPEADVKIFSEYAIKCVSQANSASSRRWRTDFLKTILSGTYERRPPSGSARKLYFDILDDCALGDSSGFCPVPIFGCPLCDNEIEDVRHQTVLGWPSDSQGFQVSNAQWIHISCLEKISGWSVIHRPNEQSDDQPSLF